MAVYSRPDGRSGQGSFYEKNKQKLQKITRISRVQKERVKRKTICRSYYDYQLSKVCQSFGDEVLDLKLRCYHG